MSDTDQCSTCPETLPFDALYLDSGERLCGDCEKLYNSVSAFAAKIDTAKAMTRTLHDMEEAAARRALEAVWEMSDCDCGYCDCPYDLLAKNLRAIDPAQFRSDRDGK